MRAWIILLVIFIFTACKDNYTPKPRGYFRIDFPDKTYSSIVGQYPYGFDIPNYSKIEKDHRNKNQENWINITVPENKVEIHISYYDLEEQNKSKRESLIEFMEDTRRLAYKHSIKANVPS